MFKKRKTCQRCGHFNFQNGFCKGKIMLDNVCPSRYLRSFLLMFYNRPNPMMLWDGNFYSKTYDDLQKVILWKKPHQNWPLISIEIIRYITRLDTQVLLCGVKTYCNVNWRTHFDIWCGMKKCQILWMNLWHTFRTFHGFLGAWTKFGQIMWCP